MRSKNKRLRQETSKPVNYNFVNQLTFDFLRLICEPLIFSEALDPAYCRQPLMTLLFIKRRNDTFEENAERLMQEDKSQNRNRHYFFIPKVARWLVLSDTF